MGAHRLSLVFVTLGGLVCQWMSLMEPLIIGIPFAMLAARKHGQESAFESVVQMIFLDFKGY